MPKYRSKPGVVEAMRIVAYTELLAPRPWNDHQGGRIWRWMIENGVSLRCDQDVAGPAYGIIPTLDGDMRADIGDWIIRGAVGEFYPCKPETFKAAYEPVEEDTEAQAQRDYLIDGIHALQANYEHDCPMLCIACDLSGLAAQGMKDKRVPNRPVELVIKQRDAAQARIAELEGALDRMAVTTRVEDAATRHGMANDIMRTLLPEPG